MNNKLRTKKVFYILIGTVIAALLCLGGIGLFLQWKISTYEKEFSRLDVKVEEAIKRLNLHLVEKRIEKGGVLPTYSCEETLNIPFDYSLDRLISQIKEEFSLPPMKIYQIKEEDDLKDSYQILVNLGDEKRITHTLKFVLKKVKIALIIDDFGYTKGRAVDIFLKELAIPLTVSIIPGTKYARVIAEEAHRSGKEIILHLPMEPKGKVSLDYKWIILDGMGEKEIKLAVEEAIKNVPYAVGLNNHMGSLITTKERPMKALLEVVKKEGLFFVDSRTDLHSIALSLAQEMEIKSTSRQVFLDNEKKIDYIKKQLQELISRAKVKGEAVGTGHANITTALAIKETLATLDRRKIDIVSVSEIVK